MNRRRFIIVISGQTIAQRLSDLLGKSSIIEYWPLSDNANGAVWGRNGAASNVTFDGQSSSFNGTSSYVNLIAASGLVAAFNGREGTIYRMIKVSAVGVWSDGVQRYFANFALDGNNYITSYRQAAANNGIAVDYKAGGTQEFLANTVGPGTGWIGFGHTWSLSGDKVQPYLNGVANGAGSSTLGTFSATPIVTAIIGAGALTPANVWSGYIARTIMLNRAATPAEMASIHALVSAGL